VAEAAAPSKPGRLRQFGVGVLVVLTCVTVTAASAGFWVNRNFLNTSVWVKRVAPLPREPAVQDALVRSLTTQTMTLIDPAALFNQALPDRGKILAVPLSGAVESFVSDKIRAVVASDAFTRVWVGLNERAHKQAVAALRGEGPLIQARNQAVVINLVPVINGLLQQFQSLTPELFGRKVDLPQFTGGELPDAARQRLGAALGVQLPANFGEIPVYEATQLKTAQKAVQAFDKFFLLTVVLSLVLIPLTVWLSRRRRRTGLQMIFGISLGIVLLRRAAYWAEKGVLAQVQPASRAAVNALLRAFIDPLATGSALLLIGLALLAAGLLVTGPYAWAEHLRRSTGVLAAGNEASNVWVRDHRQALQVAGGGVVAVGVLLFDISWPAFFVVLALLVAYEVAVTRAGGVAPPRSPEQSQPAPTPAPAPSATPPG
jgi:hypothetical protein